MWSPKACTVSSRRWWKAGVTGSAGGCLWLGTGIPGWAGGEMSGGEQSWTSPPIRIQRQFYVLRVSCMFGLVSHLNNILCYSWLEAITIWLKKRPWMGPDLFPSLQIMVLIHCLHLSKKDLNVNSAFCILEQHKIMEPVTSWWNWEIIKVLEEY